ncbi:hypothetical protein GDO81_006079 [Engystomops pustulosus]|uniref:ZP domain-containing protein n=1 Tax=Engystomops pustulosus TaxID=76066 RepID=A0AAV7CVI1_ENGPU|nr:hypothetical protein GDO81_006079 [Engystomops pustulosus]
MKTFLAVTVILSIILSAHAACEVCASDEYCDASTNCSCNSTLYSNIGKTPEPKIDCSGGTMNVFISKCWLEKNGYNSTNITLTNNTCVAAREIVNDTALMTLHRSLAPGDCGNTLYVNSSHVIYSNHLYIHAKTSPIQTRNDVNLSISCVYPLNSTITLNVTLKPVIGTTVINIPDTQTTLPVNMVVYKDNIFSTLLSVDDPLYVDSTVYLSVYIPDINVDTFKIKVLRIYASPAENGPTFDLLKDGCPTTGLTANLLSVANNGNSSESRFLMKVFQITGYKTLNITAELQICTQNCQIDCSTQSKSASSQGNTGFVSVLLTADELYENSSANTFSLTWTLSSVLLALILEKLV